MSKQHPASPLPPQQEDTGDKLNTIQMAARFLGDLVLFEGSEFILPHQLIEPAESIARSSASGQSALPSHDGQVETILAGFRQEICECKECPLGHKRQQFVFGSGKPDADIMFIGEAPGAEEDRQGLPFVGAAGQLLTKIIEAMHLGREDVYICNVLKCRPPNNRDPLPNEVDQCEPYLKRQIEIVQPKIICTLGRIASQAILKTTAPMRSLRGVMHQYEGIPVIVTYHPAALLRNVGFKRDTWEDVKWLRREYDGVEL